MRRLALLLAVTLAGCQSYQPSPLNLHTYGEFWTNRDPASPAVAAYAAKLASLRSPTEEAVSFDPSDGLKLAEARTVALYFNPRLRAARLKARVPAVGAKEAGRWADPVLQVDAERIIDSVAHPWIIGGLLNLTIPLSGQPALERQQAIARAGAAAAEALAEEYRVLAELDEAWTDLRLADERIELMRSHLSDLDTLTTQAERLRAAAELSPIEAGLFRVEQARRRIELQYLQARRAEQEIAVKLLLGLTPKANVALTLALPTSLPHGNLSSRQHIEASHPRLLVAKAEYAVAEQTLELEIRRQYPNLTLGGGYGRDEGTRRVLGGLGIPIPLFNANRRAIAEARANRDAARAAAEAAYEEVVGAVARAEALLNAARSRRDALARDVAPLADEQLQAASNLGRLGNVNTIVIFEALARAHETRLDLLEATAVEATAINQLNALVRATPGLEPADEVKR